jgi:hypothetical protein
MAQSLKDAWDEYVDYRYNVQPNLGKEYTPTGMDTEASNIEHTFEV